MTAAAEDVDAAFRAALEQDAGVPPTEIPAPPRRSAIVDPEAPHGRAEDGTPHAPYGMKNGTSVPRLKPAGPGQGGKKTAAERPRVTTAPKAPGRPAAVDRDYREDLAGLGMSIWMGGAALPVTRPYAHVFKQAMPGMVNAWNNAAQSNATVRGYVEKLSGEGSYAWVIGVALSTAPLVAGFLELAKRGKTDEEKAERRKLRAELAAACEADFQRFMAEQMAGMGIEQPEPAAA